MTTSDNVAKSGSRESTQQIPVLLLCSDSMDLFSGLSVGRIASAVAEHAGTAPRGFVVDDLCSQPGRIRDVLQADGRAPVVLGVCRGEYSRSDLRQHAKKAGGHPLAAQIVELKGRQFPASSDPGSAPHIGPLAALASAMARVMSVPAPSANSMKPVLLTAGGRVSRRSLFTLPPVDYVGVPSIRRDVCMASEGCAVCVKNCPHGALTLNESTVSIDRKACLSCGICVSACPQQAIEQPGNSTEEIEAHLGTLAASAPGSPVVFSCDKAQDPPSDGWHVIPVACAGMVPVSAMAAALNGGASSVAVRQCTATCAQRARDAVAGRIDFLGGLLDAVGDNRSRVALLRPADEGANESAPPVLPETVGERIDRVFGVLANWAQLRKIGELADLDSEQALEHPYSPTGRVEFDATTCTTCGTCAVACPTNAITEERDEQSVRMTFDSSRCVACGECVTNCPEVAAGAISMKKAFGLGSIGPALTYGGQDSPVRCAKCGQVFTTTRLLERLRQILGDDYSHKHMGELCSDCRGLPG